MPVSLPPELGHLFERFLNRQGIAEGSNLPPPIRGSQRVPFVRSPQVFSTDDFLGGTLVNIGWLEPEYTRNISHFNVYAKNTFDANQSPTFVGSAPRSPAAVRVMTDAAAAQSVIFTIQTVLKNGMTTDVETSPTVTAQIRTAQVTEDDLVTGVLAGYETPLVDTTTIDLDSVATTTLINETVAGALFSLGIVIGPNTPDATCVARFNIQLDGGGTVQYPVLNNGLWTTQLRGTNASIVGTGGVLGDSATIPLYGITYNSAAVVSFQVTATGSGGAGDDITVFVQYARKS